MKKNIKYPRAKPYFSNDSKKKATVYFNEIINTGNLIQGKYVKEFEDRVAEYIGTKYAVATNSCTSALEITIKSLNIKNKKILVPSQTFVATANAVILSGNIPVFTDINKDTFCLSLESIKQNVTEDVAAIILVHIGGLITPEYYDIKKFCDENNIVLLEDAAHAFGSKIDGKNAGNLGVAGCFSFFPTKIITTGEGGVITTNSQDLAEAARLYRNHGGDGKNFYYNSSNYRMTEINASIGLTQLDEIEFFISQRNKIADMYVDALKEETKIKFLPTYKNIHNSFWNIYCTLENELDREVVMEKLLNKGIQTGNAYFPSCHHQPAFKNYLPDEHSISVTESVLKRHISLPMYVGLQKHDVYYIASSLKEVLGEL